MQVWLPEDFPFTLGIAADDSETVGIGVGSYDEVGIEACSEFHTECHGFRILGVG